MLTLYALKPAFQSVLRPAVGALAGRGATANQVTVAAALGSSLVGAIVALNADSRLFFLLLPLWLLARMALNAIDGMLARDFGQKSDLGAYLNELGDVVSDAALYWPFALLAPFGPFWISALILLAALSEFAGVLGQAIGKSRRYDGPMGKSDRALIFGALATWVGFGGPLFDGFAWLMPIVAGLLIATVANRVRNGLRERGISTHRDPPAR